MPSRKSPSQRAFTARVARALGGAGTHSGRVISAVPPPAQAVTPPTRSDPIYLEAIVKAGTASVGTNLMLPGFRVPAPTTLRAVYVNVDTAPTGAALVYVLKRKSTGATLATVTVAAGSTSGSMTGLSASLAKGELLRSDITAVGSGVAGADVLVTVEAY